MISKVTGKIRRSIWKKPRPDQCIRVGRPSGSVEWITVEEYRRRVAVFEEIRQRILERREKYDEKYLGQIANIFFGWPAPTVERPDL